MLSSSVIDNLKCTFCRNSLSIFPIHTYGDKDTVTCGRCPVKNDFLPQREILYEEVAQHLEFACQNQSRGCIERLRPTELEEHEKQCLHKPCFCPVLPVCQLQWKGMHEELFEHCKECHPKFAHESFFSEISLLQNYEENHVLRYNNEIFIVQIKCNAMENIFYSNVKYCGPSSMAKKYLYRTYFAGNEEKKRKFDRPAQLVLSFEAYDPILTETVTSTDFNEIVTNLKEPADVRCQVDILMTKLTVKNIKTPVLRKDTEVLKTVECPVCMDYMKPPIIQCIRGHSFCETCRMQLLECPTCRGSIDGTRNYLLENITQKLDYPCKYNKYGCTFTGNLQNKDNHEDTCPNKPYVCSLVDCHWAGVNILDHTRHSHNDNIIKDSTVTYILDEDFDCKSYYFLLRDNLFSVHFDRDDIYFIWKFQLQVRSDINKYKVELSFGREDKDRLYLLLNPQSSDDEITLTSDTTQLMDFIYSDVLSYKIRIVETD